LAIDMPIVIGPLAMLSPDELDDELVLLLPPLPQPTAITAVATTSALVLSM
jgi:hypothetical protein